MAKRGNSWGRVALIALALVVAALVISWAWNGARPKRAKVLEKGAHPVVRVQVWNGSGEGGIGTRVASALRAGGFQVVEVRNADRSDYFASMVVARRADASSAAEVAHYLGGLPAISQIWDSDAADVTVVIGSDRSRLQLEP